MSDYYDGEDSKPEAWRPSGIMRNDLVADLAMEDLGPAGDRWLTEPLRSPIEWSENFGRQLGVSDVYSWDIDMTLRFLIEQVEGLIFPWPPPSDEGTCKHLAHEATKNLSPMERYGMLRAGPGRWESAKVEGCRVGGINSELQRVLEAALARELRRVLDQWVDWDIRKLKDRRDAAIKAREEERIAEEVQAAEAARKAAPPRKPFVRHPDDLKGMGYIPPGRTWGRVRPSVGTGILLPPSIHVPSTPEMPPAPRDQG